MKERKGKKKYFTNSTSCLKIKIIVCIKLIQLQYDLHREYKFSRVPELVMNSKRQLREKLGHVVQISVSLTLEKPTKRGLSLTRLVQLKNSSYLTFILKSEGKDTICLGFNKNADKFFLNT